MRERVASAAVLVPIVVGFFLLGQPWISLGLAVVAAVAAHEAFRLLSAAGFGVSAVPAVVAPPIAVLGLGLGAPAELAVVFVGGVVILAAVGAFARSDVREGFMAWVGVSFGAIYVSLLASVALVVALEPAASGREHLAPLAGLGPLLDWLGPGRTWLLVLVLTVWSFDTFAYLAGRAHGRGRFMNHISPRKTWSGVIGGGLAASVVAGGLAWMAGEELPAGFALGLLVAASAQAGDLAESLLKRAAGAKDSGRLIPGHGGMLDRIDSFLFAGPVMVAWLVAMGLA